jgi:eukaryotic-like serine/threonine-protein kinase
MERDPTSDLARAGVVVANRYRLDAVIGRGGMGSVWSATHLGLGHRIAIKLISREFIRSADALRRFDAEAKAAARLQSRHVVQVYDNGTLDDGTPYIAMELLSGESLQHRIEERGRIALPEAVQILGQCCKALGRAHALGIVHRDIKPDNIFLARTPDEDGDVAKILDFGVAKVALDGNQGQTGTGMLLGTPLYMSPEQARGLKTLDTRADLYSLGLAAYTMLTGQLAINGESFGEVLLKICVEPLPRLCAAAPWLPPAMDGWFQRVCAREPVDRCQSAQEFIDLLRTAAGEGAAPGRPSIEGASALQAHGVAPTLVAAGISAVGPTTAASVNLSGVNVAITAAGVPRRNTGVFVVGGVMAALGIGAVVLLVALRPQAAPSPELAADTRTAAASMGSPSPAPAPATPPVARETPTSSVTLEPAPQRLAPIPAATTHALDAPTSPSKVGVHAVPLPTAARAPAVAPMPAPAVAPMPAPAVAPARAPAPTQPTINLGY